MLTYPFPGDTRKLRPLENRHHSVLVTYFHQFDIEHPGFRLQLSFVPLNCPLWGSAEDGKLGCGGGLTPSAGGTLGLCNHTGVGRGWARARGLEPPKLSQGSSGHPRAGKGGFLLRPCIVSTQPAPPHLDVRKRCPLRAPGLLLNSHQNWGRICRASGS